jgi:NhaA family Na+:H+ antiporter
VVVIAVFYADELNVAALAAAGAVLLVLVGMNALGVRRLAAYAIPGVVLWFAVYQSGVHATIAGVLLALTIPARTRIDGPSYVTRAADQLREVAARFRGDAGIEERHAALWELEDITQHAQAPMLRMEHGLHPWVAFAIVPLFALANAGVRIPQDVGAALSQPVVIGIVVGLVLGKQLGIMAAAWLVVRAGLASLPDGVAWRHMYGVAWLGGIGFTMSLFVAELAFPDPVLEDAAKLGILLASVIAGAGGFVVLFLGHRRDALPRATEPVAA